MKRLLKELQDTLRDKEESIKEHDFDIAKQLVDHEMEVRTHITIMKQAALTNEALGLTRKEVDTVVENDVAEVIEIGRARVGKECANSCRSRWSPYH